MSAPRKELDRALARAIVATRSSVERLVDEGRGLELDTPVERSYFTPAEERPLLDWFARLLTVREALWDVVDESATEIESRLGRLTGHTDWRLFLAGYVAACLVVRLDRLVVEEIATHTFVQRKLNEGSPERRLPRKQYTEIFRSLSDPRGAIRLLRAMRTLARNRTHAESMRRDAVVGPLLEGLEEFESALDPSKRRYLRLFAGFESHALRRRGATLLQHTVSGALEGAGRVASELRIRKAKPGLAELPRTRELLRPGDVLITRHEAALTNLFLPGYWPHAALYVGDRAERSELGLPPGHLAEAPIGADQTVLEALKDGVLFRPLESTLAVDAFVVLRPQLDASDIAEALERAALHEGKLYNFDFDFFRSDRLVCTEVVYRAFDGVGSIRFELVERSGRPTLSAEDLLDCAVASDGFDVQAIFGSPGAEDAVVTGRASVEIARRSYERSADRPDRTA